LSNGYVAEGNEGNILASSLAGYVPFYRLSKWNSSNNDLDHQYTTDNSKRVSLMNSGWTYDRVAGYVIATPGYAAQFVRQTVPSSMPQGTDTPVSITMRNTGFEIWPVGGDFHLGTQQPQDNYYWCIRFPGSPNGTNRVPIPNNVAVGDEVTFSFTVRPGGCTQQFPVRPFQFRMISPTYGTFGDFTPIVPTSVIPELAAEFVSKQVPANMLPGAPYSVSVTMKNTGSATWTANGPYKLGSQNPTDNNTWGTTRRSVTTSVATGGTYTFSYQVTSPGAQGTYNFQWSMVKEGVAWFGQATPNVAVVVAATQYARPTVIPQNLSPVLTD